MLLGFVAFGLILSSSPVLAQGSDPYGLESTAERARYVEPGKPTETLFTLVTKAVRAFLALIGFLFFGMMLYAGLRWMTARGNEELAEKAKHTLQATTIGIMVIISAYALTTLVLNRLGA